MQIHRLPGAFLAFIVVLPWGAQEAAAQSPTMQNTNPAPQGARTQAGAGLPQAPALAFAFEARVTLAAPVEFGQVPRGRRRVIPITGGAFEGPGIKGRVLPGGADWQIVRADGFTEIDTRYTLETDSGKLIYIQNAGMRHAAPEVMDRMLKGEIVDPALVYFRTVPTFETSAPELQWLARSIFVANAERYPDYVVVRFWRVL